MKLTLPADYMNVVGFQKFQKALRPLASEVVEDRKYWVVRLKLQIFPLSIDIRKEDLLNVHFHCTFIRPMVLATGDVPVRWEFDTWKTPVGDAFVDQLGR